MNIPNGDMVGHTGDIEATVVACKAADQAVKVINYIPIQIQCIPTPKLLCSNSVLSFSYKCHFAKIPTLVICLRLPTYKSFV